MRVYDNIYAYLSLEDELVPFIEECFKVRAPNYMYTKAFQNWRKYQNLLKKGMTQEQALALCPGKMWDGWISFYSKNADKIRFPTGLLFTRRFGALRKNFVDKRNGDAEYGEVRVYGIELRDYQSEAIDICLRAQRGIVAAATNSGKTEIAAGIISAIRKPTLFLVHRANLAFQTAERFKQRLNLDDNYVKVFGAGERDFSVITVATVQSIYTLLKKGIYPSELNQFRIVFADEAHHYQSTAFQYVLRKLPKAFWRFGLTGTPHKNLNDPKWWNFVAYTGDVLVEIKNEALIKRGISAEVEVKFYTFRHKGGFYVNWNALFRDLIEENEERNRLIAKLAQESPPGVFVAVKTIKQGENLLKLIPEAILLTGQESVSERALKVKEFSEGKIKIIIATNWFNEGMDVPEIKTLINASGGASEIELLQKLGRGLRKKADASKLLYIDIFDIGNRYLETHSETRTKILKEDGHQVEVK